MCTAGEAAVVYCMARVMNVVKCYKAKSEGREATAVVMENHLRPLNEAQLLNTK